MPLQNAANYDHKRIINALLYADSTLRCPNQKLSPIDMRAPLVDKDASTFLDMEEGERHNEKDENVEAARAEWIAVIRTSEHSMQFIACLKVNRSPDAQPFQNELLNL